MNNDDMSERVYQTDLRWQRERDDRRERYNECSTCHGTYGIHWEGCSAEGPITAEERRSMNDERKEWYAAAIYESADQIEAWTDVRGDWREPWFRLAEAAMAVADEELTAEGERCLRFRENRLSESVALEDDNARLRAELEEAGNHASGMRTKINCLLVELAETAMGRRVARVDLCHAEATIERVREARRRADSDDIETTFFGDVVAALNGDTE